MKFTLTFIMLFKTMKTILLFLPEGFEILEASAFIDVMGWNQLEGDRSTQLESCGYSKQIKSSFGQQFIADKIIEQINVADYSALALPGGFEEFGYYQQAYDKRTLQLIRDFRDQQKPIASICTGALALAKSGILKGKKATTYNNPIRRQVLKNEGAQLVTETLVIEDNIITSCNPSTALYVALLLLELLTSKENADHVREFMGLNN